MNATNQHPNYYKFKDHLKIILNNLPNRTFENYIKEVVKYCNENFSPDKIEESGDYYIFDECNYVETFMTVDHKTIELYNWDKLSHDIQNKFKGDTFEYFAKHFVTYFSSDIKFGMSDYKFINDSNDLGVDAIANLTANNGKAFIQVKFRSSYEGTAIDKDNFCSLGFISELQHNYDKNNNSHRLVIIISNDYEKGVSLNAQKLINLVNHIIIDKGIIQYHINNNPDFFNKLIESL